MKNQISIIKFFIFASLYPARGQVLLTAQQNVEAKHTKEISTLSPFLKIYAIQYNYLVTEKSELMPGLAYADSGHN